MSKRIKTVYPTNRIAHIWMHKTQGTARNAGGNFYFSDEVIYSYGGHFPIARHVESKGKRCVFFTTRSYSVTTSKHVSLVHRAIPHGTTLFNVPNPLASPADVFRSYAADVKACKVTLGTARKVRTEGRRTKATVEAYHALRTAVNKTNAFAEFFGMRQRYKMPKDSATLDTMSAAYCAKQNAKQAQRDAVRSEKSRLQRIEWDKAQAEREKQNALTQGEKIADWLAGKRFGYWTLGSLPTMLRIVGDNVETSRGAEFPLDHALRILPRMIGLLESGQEWKANGQQIRLGVYSVDSISAEGTLSAGCHTISKAELLRFADVLREHAASLPPEQSTADWLVELQHARAQETRILDSLDF